MFDTVGEILAAKGLLLKAGTAVDVTIIAAPSSTKNSTGRRDPEMHQIKKGNQWHFGMKAHIGVDADSGYRDVHKRQQVKDAHPDVNWHVAMMPGKRKKLDAGKKIDALIDEVEHTRARIRSKVEHPFRVIKRQFGHVKVRYRGLQKNTAQLHTLFALANLWMVRKRILRCRA